MIKLKNETIVNKICNHIRREISNNNFKSGQHLKEADFTEKFEVSRVPVREAFRILQSEGYVEVIPHRGIFVKKISGNSQKEIAVFYKLLAPFVLQSAIPNYTESTFQKAEEILSKVEKINDFSEVGYLLWEFGRVIYGPSNLKFSLFILDEMYKYNIRLLNEVYVVNKDHKYEVSAHRKFLDLCRKNKKEEAIRIWNEHIDKIEAITSIIAKNTK